MKISKDINKITTTQSEMARVLGLTQPRIHQLVQDGIIEKEENGAILLVESLKNYYKSKQGETGALEDEADYWTERALHEKAKREMTEIKLAKIQNNIYDAKTVEMVMIEMLTTLRTQLLGLPNKLAQQLEGKNREKIYDVMTREIEDKLNELSEYSPELFTEDEIEYENSD